MPQNFNTQINVSIYTNIIYNITLYKNSDCISDLNLLLPQIDFNDCLTKLKEHYLINDDNLIVVIISKKIDGINYPKMLSYSMHQPISGEKLPSDEICKNDKLIIQENIYTKLENSSYLDSLKFLTDQNINVFNLSSDFFNDICYDFETPEDGKDIPLKDRIKLYYPNISLCEGGCQTKGINLTTFKAICECTLDNLMGSKIFGDNILYQSSFGEIENMIKKTNIEVIKCYKKIFVSKYFIKNVGGFIIIVLILIQIIVVIIYYKKYLYPLKKYILELTDLYLSYLSPLKENVLSNNNDFLFLKDNKNIKVDAPIKKQNQIVDWENANNNNNENKKKFKKKKRIKKRSRSLKLNAINLNNLMSNEINGQNNIDLSTNRSKKKSLCLNEMLLNSKEQINRHKLSTSTLYFNSGLMIHLKNELNINIKEYLCTDLDDMDYDDAIKKDNRKFCNYFCDKLKTNQIILTIFYVKDPLKPRPLKILLLILEIDLYLTINGLFFSEDYISTIFNLSNGDSFLSFLERIVERFFSITLTGVILNYIIDCFFVEEKKIKGIFKREKENTIILKYEINKTIRSIIKRNNSFIIMSFFITVFTLYYVLCFNSVYPSMKAEWIKSSIIIIIAMQIISILQILLQAFFRLISFKLKSEKLFKISLLFS